MLPGPLVSLHLNADLYHAEAEVLQCPSEAAATEIFKAKQHARPVEAASGSGDVPNLLPVPADEVEGIILEERTETSLDGYTSLTYIEVEEMVRTHTHMQTLNVIGQRCHTAVPRS